MQQKTFLIIIFSCIFTFTGIQAQNKPTQTIRGVIVDLASGAPLSYVSVGLLDMPLTGTTTNDNGEFILKDVPVGRHDLQATFVGYENSVFREIMVSSAKEVYLEIQLKEKVQELGEVVITNEVNKEKPMNNMALTGGQVLSVEQARRYAGGMDDPARLASSFAGVSPSAGNNGISIHGNAPHLLQWRLEDVEIPNPNHFADFSILGGGMISSLSSNILGNSDFYTAAFPAEFSNAVSGVFDMRMRNGNNQKMENSFQVGFLGIDFASEGPLSKKHNASYIINYRYSTVGLLNKLGNSTIEEEESIDYQDLNFKVNFPTRSAGVFSVWGSAFKDKYTEKPDKDRNKWETLADQQKTKTDQTAASVGISHRYIFGNSGQLKTSFAATYAENEGNIDMDYDNNMTPFLKSENRYTNLIFKSSFNKKFSSRFTNQTGVSATKLYYKMSFHLAPHVGKPLDNISEGDGSTELISAYNSSLISLNDKMDLSVGINTQTMTLNKEWTIEPRISMRWQASNKSSFAVAYGMYSRMEKMDVYFVKTKGTQNQDNKKLGFTKSHQVSLTYDYKISDNMRIKIEPFAQFLYDVPVMADSSYSVLNRKLFLVEDPLVNKGKGRNIGVDITFERYLTQGLYYMVTGSIFSSRYCGGDGVWHNSRYDRKFVVNGLIGKEWMVGRNKQNVISANIKLTLQGGERYSPIDEEATLKDPDKDVQYDETRAYSKQFSPQFNASYSLSYKINKKKISHEFAVQGTNALETKEYNDHLYNFKTGKIEPDKYGVSLTNVSYRINF